MSRHIPGISFARLDSFDEVRRGVSNSVMIALPSTYLLPTLHGAFPAVDTNQSSALLPSRPTDMLSTVALTTHSTMACLVFVSARRQRICLRFRCLWFSKTCLHSSATSHDVVLIVIPQAFTSGPASPSRSSTCTSSSGGDTPPLSA